jgi:hypothetical protein
MSKHVLLVDPIAGDRLPKLQPLIHGLAQVIAVEDFPSARACLREALPDLLVTNLRLGAYNGIHLALLASRSRTPCIVYAKEHDLVLARQAQAAGAFYVRLEHLPFVLPAFVGGPLPSQDRRDPAVLDRRETVRRGRRSTDLPGLHATLRRSATVESKRQ